jgi:hypothetical protein
MTLRGQPGRDPEMAILVRDDRGETPSLPFYLIRVTRRVAVSNPSTDRRRIS